MQLLADDLTVTIAFSAAVVVLVAVAVFVAGLVVAVAFAGDDTLGDVQRSIELSAAAHALLAKGPLLSDPDGEASAAIDRLLAKKDEAHRSLWRSRETMREDEVSSVPQLRFAQVPIGDRLTGRTPIPNGSFDLTMLSE